MLDVFCVPFGQEFNELAGFFFHAKIVLLRTADSFSPRDLRYGMTVPENKKVFMSTNKIKRVAKLLPSFNAVFKFFNTGENFNELSK